MNEEIKFWFPHGDKLLFVIRVMEPNLMHYSFSVYFIIQPLHISGISVAHHQEVYSITWFVSKVNVLFFLCTNW